MDIINLVIATGNIGKLNEIRSLLAPLQIEVLPQSDFNVPEAAEPHCTFVENALAKARHASHLTGLPALADDSGICVDALGGAPGVISAHYAGEPRSDERNNLHLLDTLKNQQNRKAHYHCVMVLVRHADDPQPLIAEGSWHGEILTAPRGEGGFGYDPLFLDTQLGKTGAELPLETKNRISHRGLALAALIEKIKTL
jgi:XTP/dITP diphosphohydrolase